MLDVIASAYPRLTVALRRSAGMSKADSAALILSARYGTRAGIWTAEDCAKARRMIAEAFAARPRLAGVR